MQFGASFGTSFLYYSRKWGDYPPVLKVGGPIPLPPPAPTPMKPELASGAALRDSRTSKIMITILCTSVVQ